MHEYNPTSLWTCDYLWSCLPLLLKMLYFSPLHFGLLRPLMVEKVKVKGKECYLFLFYDVDPVLPVQLLNIGALRAVPLSYQKTWNLTWPPRLSWVSTISLPFSYLFVVHCSDIFTLQITACWSNWMFQLKYLAPSWNCYFSLGYINIFHKSFVDKDKI